MPANEIVAEKFRHQRHAADNDLIDLERGERCNENHINAGQNCRRICVVS